MNTIARRAALFAALTSVVTLSACAAPQEEDAEGATSESAISSGFDKVVSCDGSAIEVNVKQSERRDLEVKINDKNIAKFLADNSSALTEQLDPSGRLTLSARVGNGVFERGQWSGLEIRLGSSFAEGAVTNVLRVYRDFGGLKAQIVRPPTYVCYYPNRGASGGNYVEWNINSQSCPSSPLSSEPGQFSQRRPESEVANWFFRQCN